MPSPASIDRPRALFLLVLLALALVACASRALLTPPPMGGAGTPEKTRQAILRALGENRWTLMSDKEGEIVARYGASDWDMVVQIAYQNEVSIRYVSSRNLDYGINEQGVPVIHRGYNRRVEKLSRLIDREITVARAIDALPPVGAAPKMEPIPE
jgi:hypothetical protein